MFKPWPRVQKTSSKQFFVALRFTFQLSQIVFLLCGTLHNPTKFRKWKILVWMITAQFKVRQHLVFFSILPNHWEWKSELMIIIKWMSYLYQHVCMMVPVVTSSFVWASPKSMILTWRLDLWSTNMTFSGLMSPWMIPMLLKKFSATANCITEGIWTRGWIWWEKEALYQG